jgi:hypothetical protein
LDTAFLSENFVSCRMPSYRTTYCRIERNWHFPERYVIKPTNCRTDLFPKRQIRKLGIRKNVELKFLSKTNRFKNKYKIQNTRTNTNVGRVSKFMWFFLTAPCRGKVLPA